MPFFNRDRMNWRFRAGVSFFAGFLAGIALIWFNCNVFVKNSAFLDKDSFTRVIQLVIDKESLLFYCLQNRLEVIIIILLLSISGIFGAALIVICGWFGLSAGFHLTVLSVRYGIKGILLFLGCVLPQQILLIPGWLFLLEWCSNRKNKRNLVISFLMIGFGCFLEAYVNPSFLKLILHIFMD